MKRVIPFVIALALGLGLSCDEESFSVIIVSGQVTKTLNPESNTASVLLGKATFANLFLDTPDPGDSTFWQDDPFPATVTPIGGADVQINSGVVGQKIPGVYFEAAMNLEHLARYELEIETPDGELLTAHGCLPDSFSVVAPSESDTLNPDSVVAVWTHSDSAEVFLVGITPADSTAQGWADATTDTTIAVPVSAFQDTLGTLVPGEYTVVVTAVNGGWHKSGLDLFLSGGNVSGDGIGTFGCAVYPKPVVFRVESR